MNAKMKTLNVLVDNIWHFSQNWNTFLEMIKITDVLELYRTNVSSDLRSIHEPLNNGTLHFPFVTYDFSYFI